MMSKFILKFYKNKNIFKLDTNKKYIYYKNKNFLSTKLKEKNNRILLFLIRSNGNFNSFKYLIIWDKVYQSECCYEYPSILKRPKKRPFMYECQDIFAGKMILYKDIIELPFFKKWKYKKNIIKRFFHYYHDGDKGKYYFNFNFNAIQRPNMIDIENFKKLLRDFMYFLVKYDLFFKDKHKDITKETIFIIKSFILLVKKTNNILLFPLIFIFEYIFKRKISNEDYKNIKDFFPLNYSINFK